MASESASAAWKSTTVSGPDRHRNLRVILARDDHPLLLEITRRERCERNRIVLDVPRALRARIGDDRERLSVLREHAERDDACVRLDLVALHAVLPQQRVLGQLACERRAEARQLLQSCIDEAPLERRHDDHVGGAERAGDDPDEDEDDADPDSAGERHAVTPTGSDSPRRAS